MYVETISIELDSPGAFALAEVSRRSGNNILIAANAQPRFAQVQAGYLYVQLLLRGPVDELPNAFCQILAGPTWSMWNPSWTGQMQLSDDMFIVCRAASVALNTVRFNLSFLHLDKGEHYGRL